MQPKITTTITCVKCGGSITGGDKEYLVVCPYCGVEYQLSISAVVVEHVDIEEKIKTLIACVIDGNERERAEACLELAKIRDGRVAAPLIMAHNKLMDNIDDYKKYQPAIQALGDIIQNISDPAAADALIEAIKDEKNSARQLAAFAMKNIAVPASVGPLIDLAHDSDVNMRYAALTALGKIKDDRIPGVLISALQEDNYTIKISALQALSDLKLGDAAEDILNIFKDDKTSRTCNGTSWAQVRTWAARALGQIGYEPAVTALMKAMKDDDGNVREAAYYALMYISGATEDEALKDLIKKARDEFAKINNA